VTPNKQVYTEGEKSTIIEIKKSTITTAPKKDFKYWNLFPKIITDFKIRYQK
jgi:hypothetical protein